MLSHQIDYNDKISKRIRELINMDSVHHLSPEKEKKSLFFRVVCEFAAGKKVLTAG